MTTFFFGPLLLGFDVTHITIETLDSGDVRVKPWVGAIELREERILAPGDEASEEDGWEVESDWKALVDIGTLIGTLGTVFPIVEHTYSSLELDEQGQLVVHRFSPVYFLFCLVVPVRYPVDDWFVYAEYSPERVVPEATDPAAPDAGRNSGGHDAVD